MAFLLVAALALISLGEGIMMGSEVKPHSHPYMASIQVPGRGGVLRHVCGGVLVGLQWVMTSAHCLRWKSKLTVVLGAHSLSPEHSQQIFGTTKSLFKSRFVWGYYSHDIGLIKLDRAATVTRAVRTVQYQREQSPDPAAAACGFFSWGCSPPQQPTYPPISAEVVTAGWGRNWYSNGSEATAAVLSEALIEVKEQSFCSVSTADYSQLLCATAYRNCYGCACEGDLGNPLLLDGVVVGVTTQWAWQTCGHVGTRDMYYTYTQVARHAPWITHSMARHAPRITHSMDQYGEDHSAGGSLDRL